MPPRELRMSYDTALALGATLPRDVNEHRDMLRAGHHLLIRLTDHGGLPMFWKLQPGLTTYSSLGA